MKTMGIAATALLISAGAAQANCSTASLAGSWAFTTGTSICTATVSSAGVVTGTCGSGMVSMTSACKLSGTINGQTVAGRSEAIAPASALKPNLLIMSIGTKMNAGYRK